MGEPRQVVGVGEGGQQPQQRRRRPAGGDPAPAGMLSAGAIAVDQSQHRDGQNQEHRPAQQVEQQRGVLHEWQHQRDRHQGGGADQQEAHAADGERQALQGQLHIGAPLGLVVGDVEAVDQRLHAGIGAPQRQHQADHEGQAQRRPARLGNQDHLLADKDHRVARRDPGHGHDLGLGVVHVGEQPVERHERRQPREGGQQREEGHPAGHRGQPVAVELAPGAPEDVAPALGRDLLGRARLAAAPRLVQQHQLRRLGPLAPRTRP